MTTYLVSKTGQNGADVTGEMTDPFRTIQYAIGRAAADDVILVEPGVYREKVTVDRPLSLVSLTKWGAVIDGGYGPELARQQATGKWVIPTVPKANSGWQPNREYGGLVEIGATATVLGFTIRNAAGQGVKLINEEAPSGTIIDGNRIDWTYDGAIALGAPAYRLKDVQIINNVITRSSVRLFDPLRDGGGPESVATTIKPLHCDNTLIAGNIVMWCFGEGISAAKGSINTLIADNVIGPCYHWLAGNQRGQHAVFNGNFIFHTGHTLFINAKGEIPDGLVIGDEGASSASGEGYAPVITNNIVVNCGEGLGLRATGNYTTQMSDMVVSYNVFWQGPNGRYAVDIETGKTAAGAWRDHENNLIENNVIIGEAKATRSVGVHYRNNGWTPLPPLYMSGPGDVALPEPDHMPLPALPEFVLNAAECPVPSYEELRFMAEFYRLPEGSPGIGAASDGSAVKTKDCDVTPPPVYRDFAGVERTTPGDIGAFEYAEPEPPPPPPPPPPPLVHDLALNWDPEAGVITATCGDQVKRALVTVYSGVIVSVQE